MHVPAALLSRLAAYASSGDAAKRYAQHSTRKDCTAEVPVNPLLFVPQHIARAMDEDLARAGIEKHTTDGKLDFHACRVAYVNLVIESGVDIKTAQEAARHSNPGLTMNNYGRSRAGAMADLAEAVGGEVLSEEPPAANITPTEQTTVRHANHCPTDTYVVVRKDSGVNAISNLDRYNRIGSSRL